MTLHADDGIDLRIEVRLAAKRLDADRVFLERFGRMREGFASEKR
jgi:hypothetical protein